MFPVSWFVLALFLCAYAVAGMALGATTGWFVSLLAGIRRQLLKDAFLGAFGYLAGFIGCVYMPWPRNTVITNLPGGGTVATTMSSYQHPERVAIIVAILIPLLYELSRWKKLRAA